MTTYTQKQDARRGRPPRISRQAIGEAALSIGIDQVTLQKVADALGVDHSSLYRHVQGRQDILSIATEIAVGNVDWRLPDQDWRSLLERTARSAWDLYRRYPGLAHGIREFDETPLAIVLVFASMVQQLEDRGFARSDAALIIDSIMDMTMDCAIAWEKLARRDAQGRSNGETMLAGWKGHADAHPEFAGQIGEMQRVLADAPHHWWERKLGLLVEGAAALLGR